MIKTEIIGYCQKINRIVKLMELSDTITQKWRRGHGRCGKGDGGVGARVIFVCPSDFESPFFSIYTNDEPLKINFRFSDPNPFSCLLNLGFETITLLALNFYSIILQYHIDERGIICQIVNLCYP
jgi:hypothetical protein